MIILASFIAAMSVFAFIMMWVDKRQAKMNGWRIPEKRLWQAALFGGGIGAYLGMMLFRHKTQKDLFQVGFLVLALAQLGILVWVAY